MNGSAHARQLQREDDDGPVLEPIDALVDLVLGGCVRLGLRWCRGGGRLLLLWQKRLLGAAILNGQGWASCFPRAAFATLLDDDLGNLDGGERDSGQRDGGDGAEDRGAGKERGQIEDGVGDV